jgi:hypothetical protein
MGQAMARKTDAQYSPWTAHPMDVLNHAMFSPFPALQQKANLYKALPIASPYTAQYIDSPGKFMAGQDTVNPA